MTSIISVLINKKEVSCLDAYALQMAIYELDGLPIDEYLSDKPTYQYVDKLRDILLDRVFKKDIVYENVFPGNRSSNIANSIREWFDDRKFWNVGWLNLSAECGIDAWNNHSGFTYDITDFALICLVSCHSGEDIISLTEDSFSSLLPEIYEMYFWEDEYYEEEDREDFYAELSNDCMEFIEEMQSCFTVTDWKVVRSSGLVLLKDFSKYIFCDTLTPEEVFENIQPIADFCFGGLDGIDRTLYTFVNQHLNVILRNEKRFLDNAGFKELKELLALLERPIYDDNVGFEPIVVSNKEYYSITVVETDKSNIYNSRPFLGQMLDRIDELTLSLVSLLPAELLPVSSN